MRPTPTAPGSLWSSIRGKPAAAAAAAAAAAWTSVGSRSRYRLTGIGPSSPCHGRSPKSTSASRRRKYGSTSSNAQPGLPRAAHPSKSAGEPRTANRVNHDVPPTSRPRRSFCGSPPSTGLGRVAPIWRAPKVPAVEKIDEGAQRAGRAPPRGEARNRSPAAASRDAIAQPAAPAPMTTKSKPRIATHGASLQLRRAAHDASWSSGDGEASQPDRRGRPSRVHLRLASGRPDRPDRVSPRARGGVGVGAP